MGWREEEGFKVGLYPNGKLMLNPSDKTIFTGGMYGRRRKDPIQAGYMILT